MKRKYVVARCLFVWVLFACGPTVACATTEVGVDLGLRTDDLKWSIPGEFTGKDGNIYQQNIVSELTWKNIKSKYLSGHGSFEDGQFVARVNVGRGNIDSGDNQDSDYRGNNRTQEFSRSNNKSNGDTVSDMKLGFGLKFSLMADEVSGSKFQLTPMAGLSSHVQSLRMTNMRQTVSETQYAPVGVTPPAVGSYFGLNSSYKASWKGPFIGIDALFQVNHQIAMRANFEHHKADYSARANWNLREDLAHPKSFAHTATGDGNVWQLGLEMELAAHAQVMFSIVSQEWTTSTGTDRFYFSDGVSDYGLLNPVKWHSQAYQVGFQVSL
ncbi:MAG: hypothetical protein HY273_14455 [Gammaproteobacteria bacterium]|nr:hypothetical protein [Gammaproteobacteria bacterium]